MGKARWLALILLLITTLVWSAATGGDKAQPAAAAVFRIVPWIEIDLDSDVAVNSAVAGLSEWQKTTDIAIVSVSPGEAPFFHKLRKPLPDMRIIPGLKTCSFLQGQAFDSIEPWRRLALEVRAVCEAGGVRRVLIDNEAPLLDYVRGKYELDTGRLREALTELPKDVRFIWYPGVVEHGAALERSLELCQLIDSVLNVRFVDRDSLCPPRDAGRPVAPQETTRAQAMGARPTIPLIHACGDRMWSTDRIPNAIELAKERWGASGEAIIYPGTGRWVQGAREVRRLRTASGRTPGPVFPAQILPWVEVNYMEPWRIDQCAEGLRIWQKVTDTAIVSTLARHDRMPLYTELRQRVPGMHIIPGIKTGSVVGSPPKCTACMSERFDSVEGWQVIATAVKTVMALSGEGTVALENESAIRRYVAGEYDLDLEKLREGLRKLPKAKYIWYPGILGRRSDDKHRRYVAIAEVAVEVLDAQLTGHSIQGTYGARSNDYRYFRETHRRLSARPAAPILYFCGPALEYGWLDDQVHEALGYVARHWGTDAKAIIYPGSDQWVHVAELFAALEKDPPR